MFNDTPAQNENRLLGVRQMVVEMEWMNECLTTPQLKMKIGYWVSDKW